MGGRLAVECDEMNGMVRNNMSMMAAKRSRESRVEFVRIRGSDFIGIRMKH